MSKFVPEIPVEMISEADSSSELNPLNNMQERTYFHGNLDSPMSSCIMIASHVSNINRIPYIFTCLDSLFSQTVVIPVYLSISFETREINEEFAKNFIARPYLHNDLFYLYAREEKLPQMRHIFDLFPILKQQYHWIFFCDDDDTYEPIRVQNFLYHLQRTVNNYRCTNRLVQGIYESHHNTDHRHKRHEYWCYCINMRVFDNFYNKLIDYPDVVNHKCCDVLLAEYLRRHSNNEIYVRLNVVMYHYRTEGNDDSITGKIRDSNKSVRQAREVTDENRDECANELNAYLDDNLDMYLHDVFVFTIVGQNFDQILHSELKSEYCIKDLVKSEHMDKMQQLHTSLVDICNRMYSVKFSK